MSVHWLRPLHSGFHPHAHLVLVSSLAAGCWISLSAHLHKSRQSKSLPVRRPVWLLYYFPFVSSLDFISFVADRVAMPRLISLENKSDRKSEQRWGGRGGFTHLQHQQLWASFQPSVLPEDRRSSWVIYGDKIPTLGESLLSEASVSSAPTWTLWSEWWKAAHVIIGVCLRDQTSDTSSAGRNFNTKSMEFRLFFETLSVFLRHFIAKRSNFEHNGLPWAGWAGCSLPSQKKEWMGHIHYSMRPFQEYLAAFQIEVNLQTVDIYSFFISVIAQRAACTRYCWAIY